MTTSPRHERPAPLARWIHALIGSIAMIAGLAFVERGLAAELLILGAIAYVAWTVGRAPGVALATCAGIVELARRAPAESALVPSIAWLLIYVCVALLISAIETGTRPTMS